MEILVESYTPHEANLLVESSDKDKNMFLSGTIMQAGEKNRNGRIYQLHEMTSAVTDANKIISEQGGIFGEADHPKGLQINFDRVSHALTEMKMNGNNVYGKIKLLNTPMGRIAKELAESGVRYGVSSRGTGNVRDDGIVEGFSFVTVDLVINPSANAYPNTIYESLNNKLGERILTLAESLNQDPSAQTYFKKEFKKFLEKLTK